MSVSDHVGHINQYLHAQIAAEQHLGDRVEDMAPRPFVTISRETGTGGRALADVMLETFAAQDDPRTFDGWQVYDRTLCEIVAEDPRFAKSLDSLLEEEYRSRMDNFFEVILGTAAGQSALMNRVFLVVRSLVGMGKVIIIGRGGSHVTKGMPAGVSIRLVAPEPARIARLMKVLDLNERDARATSSRRDADRARLLKASFGVDIADPAEYDVTFNTGSSTFEQIAATVTALVRSRVHADDA